MNLLCHFWKSGHKSKDCFLSPVRLYMPMVFAERHMFIWVMGWAHFHWLAPFSALRRSENTFTSDSLCRVMPQDQMDSGCYRKSALNSGYVSSAIALLLCYRANIQCTMKARVERKDEPEDPFLHQCISLSPSVTWNAVSNSGLKLRYSRRDSWKISCIRASCKNF